LGTKPDFYDALRASGLKVQYDHHIRNLLRFRPVISHILIRTLREYSGLSPLEASALIDPVHTEAMLVGESIEDAVPDEGEVLYDLRFSAEIPLSEEAVPDSASRRNADCSRAENRAAGKSLCLLINLEAQKKFYQKYRLVTRGIFYGARMLSAQKGIEFIGRDYDNIRKVYSIWICMNAPDYIGNAVSEYSICKKDRVPGIPDEKKAYDKLTVVMICLNPDSKKGNRLTKMLGVLLAPGIKAKAKIHQLENEFDIPMENDMGEELKQMCNLSDYVKEIGMKK